MVAGKCSYLILVKVYCGNIINSKSQGSEWSINEFFCHDGDNLSNMISNQIQEAGNSFPTSNRSVEWPLLLCLCLNLTHWCWDWFEVHCRSIERGDSQRLGRGSHAAVQNQQTFSRPTTAYFFSWPTAAHFQLASKVFQEWLRLQFVFYCSCSLHQQTSWCYTRKGNGSSYNYCINVLYICPFLWINFCNSFL